MTGFAAVGTIVMLAVLCLPVSVIADEAGTTGKQPAGTHETQPQTGSASETGAISKHKHAKKPDQKDVQTRGLFAKKKKKQVGGSAGHSQPPEQTDQLTHDGLGGGKEDVSR
jgi:hypothetical protein